LRSPRGSCRGDRKRIRGRARSRRWRPRRGCGGHLRRRPRLASMESCGARLAGKAQRAGKHVRQRIDSVETGLVGAAREGRAPEGSGAPVGTAYGWYILAHQIVTKLDANSYTTEMAGLKYKLAHKRADKTTWSASDRAQRRRLVQILREMIAEIERQPEKQTAPVRKEPEPATTKAPRSASRRAPRPAP